MLNDKNIALSAAVANTFGKDPVDPMFAPQGADDEEERKKKLMAAVGGQPGQYGGIDATFSPQVLSLFGAKK